METLPPRTEATGSARRHRHRRPLAASLVALGLLAGLPAGAGATVRPAGVNGTLGDLGGTVASGTNLLGKVVTAGWDDGVTTPPTSLRLVADAIDADQLWAAGIDGRGVDVAVIDSGVAPVPGLDRAGKVLNGADLSFEANVPGLAYTDAYGHGTHMASIIAGADAAASGFRGIAPGARIVNVKVAAHDGAADVTQVIAAIDWVVAHRRDTGMNIRVISLSYGTASTQPYTTDPLALAVEAAWRNGIVVVVSGGNDGAARPSLTNPATNPFVLAVGADDVAGTSGTLDDAVPPFSSRGSTQRWVDVLAPGVSLAGLRVPGSTVDDAHPGAVVDGRYLRGSGTSKAAAVTAGAVALLLQARPDLTPDMVKAALRLSATPLLLVPARAQGAGLMNVVRASLVPSLLLTRQSWSPATGSGSVEAARGGSHVGIGSWELNGEVDVQGQPWRSAAWAPLSLAGRAWQGGTWNGATWTGSCWCTSSWSGSAWTGTSWSGKSWSGDAWSGKSWSGKSWSGKSWSGKSWSGKSWSGNDWAST